MFADALIENEECISEYLIKLATNELKIVQSQKSGAILNPTLVSLCLKLSQCESSEARDLAK